MTRPKISVIIVTYNNASVLSRAVAAVMPQLNKGDQLIVVDNNSVDKGYLHIAIAGPFSTAATIELVELKENIGFAAGNNAGYRLIADNVDYVLFLNPDAFLLPGSLRLAIEYLEEPTNARIGCLGGELLGYDWRADAPTHLIDSLGICVNWYGRWADIGQGEPVANIAGIKRKAKVKAICGALMLCRNAALRTVHLESANPFMEPFFMYKEDIELSLRIQSMGWQLKSLAKFKAFHCRGWNGIRSMVPKKLRVMSARNEVIVNARYFKMGVAYSVVKYLYVRLLER